MTVPLFQDEREVIMRPDGIAVISRRAFARDFFDYKPGQHVVFGGPSQIAGKTSLGFDLLEYIVSSEFQVYVAVSKPSDEITAIYSKHLGLRRVSDWPPAPKLGEMEWLGGRKPNGFVVWPRFGDLNTDVERCRIVTEKLLMERYARGARRNNKGGILFMDDTMIKAKVLDQDRNMVTILAMAGAMKLGMWVFIQKPTDSGRTPLWAYEQATHIFFGRGGDERMQRRYLEIAGTSYARDLLNSLLDYQFLYVHKTGGYVAIVDAKPQVEIDAIRIAYAKSA